MMTVENLMQPRYKVINIWPDMHKMKLCFGDIILLPCKDRTTNQWFIQDGLDKTYDAFYDGYPHLFVAIEWYEDRDLKDLPQYIKFDYPKGHSGTYEVFKVIEWKDLTGYIAPTNPDNNNAVLDRWHYHKQFSLPATEQEYLNYIQNKK
jgi:hypothetical protein